MIIGLTGGIASGKSTVSNYAVTRGAYCIDADKIGHRVYEKGTRAFDAVVKEFGSEVVSAEGEIDRKALGAIVFGEDGSLQRLTDIVWPHIKEMSRCEITEAHRENPKALIVLEAAVMIEAGWQDLVDELWVVMVAREIAIERAMTRDGLNREEVEARIDAQISNEDRMKFGDVILENSRSEADLLTKLDMEFVRLRDKGLDIQ